MKKSLLALAVSLAAVSGAHAAWDNGNVNPIVGNGETLLVIFDENVNHQVSYAQDLGATANFDLYHNNISTASFTQNFTLDSTAKSIFSTSNVSDLRWAVYSFHNGAANSDANGPASGLGYQATTNAAPGTKPSASDILGTLAITGVLANDVNGIDANYSTNVATTQSSATANYLGDPSNGIARNLHASVPFDTTAGITETLGFYEFDRTGSGRSVNSTQTAFAGGWTLDFNGNILTYNVQSPTVPVPAAAWLFGSGLLGLGSIARRRRA